MDPDPKHDNLDPGNTGDRKGAGLAFFISIGTGVGVALGAAFGNVALGVCFGAAIGVLLGVVFGSAIDKSNKPK